MPRSSWTTSPAASRKSALTSAESVRDFRDLTWSFYQEHRRSFSWRDTHDPYEILVSEFMLQQTQVQRVLSAYPRFLAQFPSLESLAAAGLDAVLACWAGLGYPRRALNLRRAAEQVMADCAGQLPSTADELDQLPGVGPSTAAAVAAFAFNQPTVLLETNIRSALIHHFLPGEDQVSDGVLGPLAAEVLDHRDPRNWYYALMDLGAFLKRADRGLTQRAAAYRRQTPYAGSRRALRARVLRQVLAGSVTSAELSESCLDGVGEWTEVTLGTVVAELVAEGFLREEEPGMFTIA